MQVFTADSLSEPLTKQISLQAGAAKVIEFTQDKYVSKYKESRYGFLHDVYSN